MAYLILNDIKSDLVKGLLIQSLPPITKPLMRTQVEEIDGRDGDIITQLGFQAYDRTVRIGLHGGYDVDEVIQYFATEGTVIFSNEPDKYYKYQQLGQIDLDRLIRFRQADVVFHVQPFKYSAVETALTFSDVDELETSAIEIVNNGNTVSRPSITIYGSGTVNLSINGYLYFVIDLSNDTHITLDGTMMEAYQDTPSTLKNRLVTGDYNYLVLQTGANSITWTGSVTDIVVENYSRWL